MAVSPTTPPGADMGSERGTTLLRWGVPLLRPKEQRPALRGRLRRHTVVRCPLNGHQVSVCRGLCTPSPEGGGLCGRLAPHALIGRTQAAIARHEERKGSLRCGSALPVRILAAPEETRRGLSS
jgi:hypothetical protein